MELGLRFKVTSYACDVRCFSGEFRRLGLEKRDFDYFNDILDFLVILEMLFRAYFFLSIYMFLSVLCEADYV